MALFNYIRLHSGKKFYYDNPTLDSICIEDIAHSLSQQDRYVGHTSEPFFVANHCVLVSRNLPEPLKFEGLMHDAAEAYLGDVNSILKQLLPDYKIIEKRVEALVFEKFGLAYPMNKEVKNMDLRLLATELRDFMPCDDWKELEQEGYPPLPEKIIPWGQEYCKYIFLQEFHLLNQKNG